jgi:hypothetical protein
MLSIQLGIPPSVETEALFRSAYGRWVAMTGPQVRPSPV